MAFVFHKGTLVEDHRSLAVLKFISSVLNFDKSKKSFPRRPLRVQPDLRLEDKDKATARGVDQGKVELYLRALLDLLSIKVVFPTLESREVGATALYF
jgi:hypothetical protein